MEKKRMVERGVAGLLVVVLVLSMVPMVAMPALAAPTELFFSEYIEGSSYNKALEIYNGTGAAVDLSTYTIELYSNGASSPSQTTALSGTLADGDVFVIAHPSADVAILGVADATDGSVVNFNGDDAVVLKNAGTVADVIGQVGSDPGSYWGSGDVTTQNHTLRRMSSIEVGDTDGSDTFDPALEWDGYAIDTFDGLGSHSTGGGPEYTPIYDIQYTADPGGASPYEGDLVTTRGVVTAVFGSYAFIQDGPGPWTGLLLYSSTGTMALGDLVQVEGTVSEYYGMTEIAYGDVTVLGADTMALGDSVEFEATVSEYNDMAESAHGASTLPDPAVLATNDVNQEQWEGVLVRVENVTVTNDDLGHGEWSVSDGSGDVRLDDRGSYTYEPVNGDALDAIIGPVEFAFGTFRIQPRDDSDIIFPLDYTPIYDIQYTADPGGASPYEGDLVTTRGVVTAVFGSYAFIQDGPGPWTGLLLYSSNGTMAVGDLVEVEGTVSEYYEMTEIAHGDVTVLGAGVLPGPVVLATNDVNQEQWEGVLVRVENVIVTNDDLGHGEWLVSDGGGDVVIDDRGSYTYEPVNGDELHAIIGPVEFAFGTFRIQPRDDDDIIATLPPLPLVINEFLADPASGDPGDANGDGTRDSSEDEFVEIVNNSDADMDISGWTLADSVSVRHTFPGGTVVPAQCAIVVFGGGTPTGVFGNAVVQTASNGYLGLNNGGDTVTLSDGAVVQAEVIYGGEGGNDQSLTRDPEITGSFVLHSAATGSGGALFSPGTMIDGSPFAGCSAPEVCGDPYTAIYEVQGSGDASLLDGSLVSIEGVVTGDFQTSDGLRGFYMQDPEGDADAATSDGIFVYDGSSPAVDVEVGDSVRVRGTVDEYNDLTEITDVGLVLICGTGSVAATPVELPVPVNLEPYEGMLVTFPEELTASQNYFQGRYGQVTMSSEGRMFQPTNIYRPLTDEAIALAADNWRRMFVLDDGTTSQNPDPIPYIGAQDTLRAGDTIVGLTGVVDYGPINSSSPPAYYYRLQPTEPVEFTRVNERTAEPDDVGGVVKIASFNVLNYFNGDGMGGGFPTSRGADTPEEFTRQRDKIISAIFAMGADVIGLMEIENDGYDEYSAIADLVNGLNDAAGASTYAFIDSGVGPVGSDEIAVGFIYRPATVTPLGAAAILDSSVDPDFNSDYNRPAIAQTFARSTGGGRFTAVVNHLKSKSSDCNALGDPDTGDGQGNCNLTREAAAIALTEWLATDPTDSDDPDFFIIGDLNSYAMEDPIFAIEQAGYTNLVKEFVGMGAYSYIFDGASGYMDHALATAEATWQVMGATVWHINTDEPSVIDYNTEYKPQDLYSATPYRSSDHDPVIVGFCESVPPEATITLSQDTLWPPNHKYVTVMVEVEATDNLDLDPTVALVSVVSNQPDNDLGDGDTSEDVVIVDDYTIRLRAERAGGDYAGRDRIYTITYTVTDDCGNVTIVTATVTVQHDLRGKKDAWR